MEYLESVLLESKNRANTGFPCVSLLNMLLLYTTLSGVGIYLGGMTATRKSFAAWQSFFAYRKKTLFCQAQVYDSERRKLN